MFTIVCQGVRVHQENYYIYSFTCRMIYYHNLYSFEESKKKKEVKISNRQHQMFFKIKRDKCFKHSVRFFFLPISRTGLAVNFFLYM